MQPLVRQLIPRQADNFARVLSAFLLLPQDKESDVGLPCGYLLDTSESAITTLFEQLRTATTSIFRISAEISELAPYLSDRDLRQRAHAGLRDLTDELPETVLYAASAARHAADKIDRQSMSGTNDVIAELNHLAHRWESMLEGCADLSRYVGSGCADEASLSQDFTTMRRFWRLQARQLQQDYHHFMAADQSDG